MYLASGGHDGGEIVDGIVWRGRVVVVVVVVVAAGAGAGACGALSVTALTVFKK
jgi:hypothetical protein